MRHEYRIKKLSTFDLWSVICVCGWSATVSSRKAAHKEHDLHQRSEARKQAVK